MDIQQIVSSGLTDTVTALAGVLVAFAIAFLKQHFSARQIATATCIASDAVNFAEQAAKKYGVTLNQAKYQTALSRAKELASKAGLNLTDSQWETMIESAYKKAKNELESLVNTATPYTEADIMKMIQDGINKVVPGSGADIVSIVQQEIAKLEVSFSAKAPASTAPAHAPAVDPVQQTA